MNSCSGRLNNRFPRWSRSRIPRPFYRIRYLLFSVCLSATAKNCSRILEAYRSRQDRKYRHPVKLLEQRVVWMTTDTRLVITLSLATFLSLSSFDLLLVKALKLHDAYREVLSKHLVTISVLWHGNCTTLSGRCHCDKMSRLISRNVGRAFMLYRLISEKNHL